MREDELQELLARTVMGDRAAFHSLYTETSPTVFGVLKQMLPDTAVAEDVLQDAYVKVWSRAGEFHGERGKVLGWIIAIARYRALDVIRANKRRFEITSEANLVPESVAADGGALELKTVLEECMSRLAELQRQSIIGAFVHGWTHEELANQLAQPIGTVKSRIRRGLNLLRECLER